MSRLLSCLQAYKRNRVYYQVCKHFIPMDKSWMNINRTLPQYQDGVNQFIQFAFKDYDVDKLLRCPCRKCRNNHFANRNEIFEHLMIHGVNKDYTTWVHHGETIPESDEDANSEMEDQAGFLMDEMTNDFWNAANANSDSSVNITTLDAQEDMGTNTIINEETTKFQKLIDDAEQELYPGCDSFSILSFIVQMLNIKCLYDLSGNAMNALFGTLCRAFPSNNKVPKSYDDAKKIMSNLELDYIKIDACLNDCILFRGEYAKAETCPVCGISRWKDDGENSARKSRMRKARKVPQKVLRYFPLIPRLKCMYMCSKIAVHMRWHKEKLVDDGYMRHPADSNEWKNFDKNFESFALDARNVRLGLASDGFNPFGNMSSSYSIWLVVIAIYITYHLGCA